VAILVNDSRYLIEETGEGSLFVKLAGDAESWVLDGGSTAAIGHL
jgi:hypothetical protein